MKNEKFIESIYKMRNALRWQFLGSICKSWEIFALISILNHEDENLLLLFARICSIFLNPFARSLEIFASIYHLKHEHENYMETRNWKLHGNKELKYKFFCPFNKLCINVSVWLIICEDYNWCSVRIQLVYCLSFFDICKLSSLITDVQPARRWYPSV